MNSSKQSFAALKMPLNKQVDFVDLYCRVARFTAPLHFPITLSVNSSSHYIVGASQIYRTIVSLDPGSRSKVILPMVSTYGGTKMKVKISSIFQKSALDVWPLVKKSSTLLYVTKGVLGFVNAGEFPIDWIEGSSERSNLQFFGFLPAWNHEITFREIDDDNHILYTNETGGFVTSWNHLIKVEKLSESTCTYTDEVEIEAGIFTPLVWVCANLFYRYRQWRWKSLLILNSEKGLA